MKAVVLSIVLAAATAAAQTKPRARDLGVPFDGAPGPLNAITDVPGVEVGHTTLIAGDSVRTGVTAILPRGRQSNDSVFAGWFSLNGNGEMTGTTWVEESGFLDGPLMITNTHSVGVVRDAVVAWQVKNARPPKATSFGPVFWSLPVVAETYDGTLNDVNGFHVKPEHAFQALENARGGAVAEGSVGGGTGMICYGFKGGIGTASRRSAGYTVSALVQCNCGGRSRLRIAGVPVGREVKLAALDGDRGDVGSIIMVIATDAPLLPHQLKRLARRASLGLARTGSTSGNGSGDIFIAFSTANAGASRENLPGLKMLSNSLMDPLFGATVEATEEAIVNALVAAETMTGFRGRRIPALPHDQVRDALKKYNRLGGGVGTSAEAAR